MSYYKGNGATNCKFSFYFSIWIEERRHFREILLKNKCKKKNIYNDDEFATSSLWKLRRNVVAIACFELRHEFVVIVNTHFFGVATIATKWSWRKPILTIRHRIITVTWQHFHRKFVAIVNYDGIRRVVVVVEQTCSCSFIFALFMQCWEKFAEKTVIII